MIYKNTIENIILSHQNFTIILKGKQQDEYQFSQLVKIYVRVYKKNKKQIILLSATTFLGLITMMYFFYNSNGLIAGLSASIYYISILNNQLKKRYTLIIKLESGQNAEYIIKPELKFRLIDKMRNIRATLDAQKMNCVKS